LFVAGQEHGIDLALVVPPCICRKRAAFQSFVVQKFRPSSTFFSSKRMSAPERRTPHHTKAQRIRAVAAMRSSGSGELPSDFDILRPCLSRMIR